jgi:tetratricopeptide (TPR) repeat protein
MKLSLYKHLITLFVIAVAISFSIKIAAMPATQIKSDRYPTQLINRARQLYQNEQYSAASQVWQQLATVYQQQGNVLDRAMALSNLALTRQKTGDLTEAEQEILLSLKLLQTQFQTKSQQRILANSLDIQGSIERSQGESKTAFETWQQAEKIYRELANDSAVIKNQALQAQALQDLGYYRRASKILASVQTKLSDRPDSVATVSALLSFGNTLQATGNLSQSLVVLRRAEKIANKLNINTSAILISFGNTLRALGNRGSSLTTQEINSTPSQCLAHSNLDNATAYYLQAINCYQQAALSDDLETKNKAQLNLLSLLVQNQTLLTQDIISPSPNWKNDIEIENIGVTSQPIIDNLIATIKTNLNRLPVTRSIVYDRLNLVESLICL